MMKFIYGGETYTVQLKTRSTVYMVRVLMAMSTTAIQGMDDVDAVEVWVDTINDRPQSEFNDLFFRVQLALQIVAEMGEKKAR